MKTIFVNLKRFDIPKEMGGINTLCGPERWAKTIVEGVDGGLSDIPQVEPVIFFPEAYLLDAARAKKPDSRLKLGIQGVHRDDVGSGNIGAFTTKHTARSAAALGCRWAMIGHSEERADLKTVLRAGGADGSAVHGLLNKEVLAAQAAGLKVLFCVGENENEIGDREAVLRKQLTEGLCGADLTAVVIGYEPLFAIGPGKTPPSAQYIGETAGTIKSITDVPVVYGGGLKKENAAEIGALKEIDGGLIGLTRFTGEIGFYPDEYLAIIKEYLGK